MNTTSLDRTNGATDPSPADFGSLLEPILPRAYQAALHMARDPVEAEEVVQEAVLMALKGFATFTPGTNFKAWFLRVLTNAFLMRRRKEKREKGTIAIEDVQPLYLYSRTRETAWQDAPDPARAFFDRLITNQVTEAIQSLPDQFRTVASLYFVEDLSYAEIASIIGCPVGTVRSRLHRARNVLQRSLWEAAVDCGVGSVVELSEAEAR
jgi:RNA polymerase sigma-70 factor (ECF subfamily)